MKRSIVILLLIIWSNILTAQTNEDSGWAKQDSIHWSLDSAGNWYAADTSYLFPYLRKLSDTLLTNDYIKSHNLRTAVIIFDTIYAPGTIHPTKNKKWQHPTSQSRQKPKPLSKNLKHTRKRQD